MADRDPFPRSPAARAQMLIDMGPPRIVYFDEDGEPVYRGAGLLSREQCVQLMAGMPEVDP